MPFARVLSDSSLARFFGSAAAIGAVPAILGFLLLSPPVSGEMLLLPLSSQARQDLGGHIGNRSVRLLGRGPTEGSFIVRADLPVIRDMLGEDAVLVLAVPDAGCGGTLA